MKMDAEDVADHAQRVADGVDFAVGAEIPSDGDFFDPQFFLAGEVKKFDIKGPACECLLEKKNFSCFRPKTFETALGVI